MIASTTSVVVSVLFVCSNYTILCSSLTYIPYYTTLPTTALPLQSTTMWEHSRSITAVLPGLRSPGICPMHGIENHICTLYTASEDRYTTLVHTYYIVHSTILYVLYNTQYDTLCTILYTVLYSTYNYSTVMTSYSLYFYISCIYCIYTAYIHYRTVKMWNITKYKAIRNIQSKS